MQSTVSLTEQLGAMAVVDQLRHQQMDTDEQLSLPQRRAAVAAKIRAYYQGNAIPFTDDLLEQGVRTYYSRRLVFEAPELGLLDRGWSALLVNRHKVVRALQFVAVALLVVQFGRVVHDTSLTNRVKTIVQAFDTTRIGLLDNLKAQQARLGHARQQLDTDGQATLAFLLSATETTLGKADTLLEPLQPPSKVTADNRDQVRLAVDSQQEAIRQAGSLLQQSGQQLDAIEMFLSNGQRLQDIRQDAAYPLGIKQIAVFAAQAERTTRAIRAGDAPSILSARDEVTQLETLLGQVKLVRPALDELAQLRQAIKGMKLSATDSRTLLAQADQAAAQINGLKADGARAALDNLRGLIDFARPALSLEVVDEVGIKSGVERCYDQAACDLNPGSDQGKSWYLIVRARNGAGETVDVPVTSVETRQTSWVSHFGVRVSKGEYLRLKQDKLGDGHVDNLAMGSKPANALELRFNKRVAGKPDMILEW